MEQQKAPLKFPDTEQETYAGRVAHLLEEEFAATGKQRLCYTHSYGCQQNVSDGERMNGLLAQMGFGSVSYTHLDVYKRQGLRRI